MKEEGQIQFLRVKTFHYPDYDANPMYQDIQGFAFAYSPPITSTTDGSDADGNSYRYSWWGSSTDPYPGEIDEGLFELSCTFMAQLENTLDGMPSTTSFPLPYGSIPPDVQRYLDPGTYTQCDEQEIVNHASSLVTSCTREYEAVMRIVDWCIDNLTYVEDPQHFYHYVDTHVYKGCVGLDIENRWSAMWAYGY